MHKALFIVTYLKNLEFANPGYLFLLILVPFLIAAYVWRRKKAQATLLVSTNAPFQKAKKSWKQKLSFLPFAFRMFVLTFAVLALARPQSSLSHRQVDVEGIDIVMALDISGSMMAMDFRPNRLEACKSVIKEFIENRPNDRIGLVVYSGEAYTKCPLTSDHRTLLASLESTKFGIIEDGTAIGDGLGTAVNRLRESEAKSKVIILLSDGDNNAGYMDPLSAAEIAKTFGIRVYTIGCGSIGRAPISTPHGTFYTEVKIDEVLLKKIAKETNGKYFRAQNKTKLKEVYNEIDKMEKTLISETYFTNKSEEFFPFLCIAVLFLIFEIIFRYTIFRINP